MGLRLRFTSRVVISTVSQEIPFIYTGRVVSRRKGGHSLRTCTQESIVWRTGNRLKYETYTSAKEAFLPGYDKKQAVMTRD